MISLCHAGLNCYSTLLLGCIFPRKESVLCIWSYLLAQLAGKRGHADSYGITVGMGEVEISNLSASFPTVEHDWSLLSTSRMSI